MTSAVAIRVGASLLMLANYACLAVLLPPADLGIVFIVMGFGQTLAAVVTLGLPDGLIKIAAQAESDPAICVLGTAGKALLAIGLIWVALLAAIAALPVDRLLHQFWRNASLPHAALLVWAGMVGHSLTLFVSQLLLSAHKRGTAVFVFYASGPFGLSAFLLLGHASGTVWPLLDIVVAFTASLTLFALAGAGVLGMSMPGRWRRGRAAGLSHLLRLGLPMMGTRLVGMIEAWGPVWITGLLLSSAAAAAVGAALRLLAGLLSLTQVVSFLSRPIVATLVARGDRRLLLAYSRFIATLLGCSMALISAVTWIDGHWIMQLFFGPEYHAAGWILAIFSVGYSAQWLVGNIDLALMMGGQHRQLFWVNASGTAILLAAMALGIAAAGVHGAAIAFSACMFAKFFLLAAMARQTYGFWSVPTASRAHLARGFGLLTRPRAA